MDGLPTRLPIFFPLAAAIFSLGFGCGSPVSTSKSTAPTYVAPGSSSSAPAPGGSGVVVDSDGFYISFPNASQDTVVLHEADQSYNGGTDPGTTGLTNECKVEEDLSGTTDMFCIAEIEELDLYFHNTQIQVHVPSTMCDYVRIKPYYFYAWQPGTGPTTVSYEVLADGSINDVTNSSNGVASCQYNHEEEQGPNCCLGTYSLTVTTYATDGSGTYTSETTAGNEWGGELGNCIAGAAKGSSPSFDTDADTGAPISKIHYVEGTGLNTTYEFTSPLNGTYLTRRLLGNSWLANFYKFNTDYGGAKPTPLLSPPAVTDVVYQVTPQDTYEFQCLNRADDLNARIRLMIREWNTESITSGGNPDTTGNEPGFGDAYNDRTDWGDFTTLVYPASYL